MEQNHSPMMGNVEFQKHGPWKKAGAESTFLSYLFLYRTTNPLPIRITQHYLSIFRKFLNTPVGLVIRWFPEGLEVHDFPARPGEQFFSVNTFSIQFPYTFSLYTI